MTTVSLTSIEQERQQRTEYLQHALDDWGCFFKEALHVSLPTLPSAEDLAAFASRRGCHYATRLIIQSFLGIKNLAEAIEMFSGRTIRVYCESSIMYWAKHLFDEDDQRSGRLIGLTSAAIDPLYFLKSPRTPHQEHPDDLRLSEHLVQWAFVWWKDHIPLNVHYPTLCPGSRVLSKDAAYCGDAAHHGRTLTHTRTFIPEVCWEGKGNLNIHFREYTPSEPYATTARSRQVFFVPRPTSPLLFGGEARGTFLSLVFYIWKVASDFFASH